MRYGSWPPTQCEPQAEKLNEEEIRIYPKFDGHWVVNGIVPHGSKCMIRAILDGCTFVGNLRADSGCFLTISRKQQAFTLEKIDHLVLLKFDMRCPT